MEYVGHCRFSWFGISDTGRSIADIGMARALLWHPLRMAVRFQLFETIMLPSLKAQTDQDFRLIVTVSKSMPEPYHQRLERVLTGWGPAEILVTERTDIGHVLRPVIRETSKGGSVPSVHFRIDDDDALAHDYIARLKMACARLDPGSMVSFPKGFVGFTDGYTAKHTTRLTPNIAIGLALILRPADRRSPFQIQHRKHAQKVPSFSDPTFYAYQNTVHGVNNTKGYDAVTHLRSSENDRLIRKLSNSHPTLIAGKVVAEDVEKALRDAFPFTDGPTLRAAQEKTLYPERLVEEMGFVGLMP
jgi:hypothetical protein